jgi:hypothetical protein
METFLSSDENPEELEELFLKYKTRHISLYTWGFLFWMTSLPARLAKQDPYRSLTGLFLTGVTCTLNVLVPLLVVIGVTDSWKASEVPLWIGVAFAYGVFTTVISPLTLRADENLIKLHGSMATAQGLRRLIAWDQRWFSYPMDITLTTVYTVIGLLAFSIIHRATGNYPIPAGTQFLGFYALLLIGALNGNLTLLALETPLLIHEEYRLFRHNPAQTLALQRSLRGYNQLVANDSFFITIIILLAVVLIPDDSGLLVPITLALLGLAFTSIAMIKIMSRHIMGQIIRSAKERELAALQERISVLCCRVLTLNENEVKELERLEKSYDRLAATPHSLLNLGQAINTFILAILFPTLSTIISFLFTNALK